MRWWVPALPAVGNHSTAKGGPYWDHCPGAGTYPGSPGMATATAVAGNSLAAAKTDWVEAEPAD